MKNLILFAFISILMLSVQSCGGDEENDPKPTKSNLELVKENIVGQWTFVSSEVTKDGETIQYNGGCNFDGKPSWFGSNVGDVDYTFNADGSFIKLRNCNGEVVSNNMKYTVKEINGKFILSLTDGGEFELLIDKPSELQKNVKYSRKPLSQGVSKVIVTLTR